MSFYSLLVVSCHSLDSTWRSWEQATSLDSERGSSRGSGQLATLAHCQVWPWTCHSLLWIVQCGSVSSCNKMTLRKSYIGSLGLCPCLLKVISLQITFKIVLTSNVLMLLRHYCPFPKSWLFWHVGIFHFYSFNPV